MALGIYKMDNNCYHIFLCVLYTICFLVPRTVNQSLEFLSEIYAPVLPVKPSGKKEQIQLSPVLDISPVIHSYHQRLNLS